MVRGYRLGLRPESMPRSVTPGERPRVVVVVAVRLDDLEPVAVGLVERIRVAVVLLDPCTRLVVGLVVGGGIDRRVDDGRLRERADHGLGYAIHYFPEAAYDTSGISLFEREVMPHL